MHSARITAPPRAQDPISGVQVFVLLVSVATVGLWCANGALADVFGDMGIIAVLPMVAFFGFGVLGKARPRSLSTRYVKDALALQHLWAVCESV